MYFRPNRLAGENQTKKGEGPIPPPLLTIHLSAVSA
jgi:hypothetical protein